MNDTALVVGTSKGPVEDWLASSAATSSCCDFGLGAIANYLAGILEGLLADSAIPLYWFLVGSSVGAGVLLLLISPLLVRLMHEKT